MAQPSRRPARVGRLCLSLFPLRPYHTQTLPLFGTPSPGPKSVPLCAAGWPIKLHADNGQLRVCLRFFSFSVTSPSTDGRVGLPSGLLASYFIQLSSGGEWGMGVK